MKNLSVYFLLLILISGCGPSIYSQRRDQLDNAYGLGQISKDTYYQLTYQNDQAERAEEVAAWQAFRQGLQQQQYQQQQQSQRQQNCQTRCYQAGNYPGAGVNCSTQCY